MARVCEEWFPLGTFKGQKKPGFHMDDNLKSNLDVLIKNVVNDWDWTIIISGRGMVRTGKSVLAGQVATYIAYQMERIHEKKPFLDREGLKNWVFSGPELIKVGNWLGQHHPYSPLVYDEAGSELQSRTTMTKGTQNVLNYFRECGQYNLWNILVLPDYYELPKGIAVTRSIFLIDVYYETDDDANFVRGFYKFYSKKKKKKMYLYGKKDLNYDVVKPDFVGRFFNIHCMNETEYRKKKMEALKVREKVNIQEERRWDWLISCLKYIKENGLSCRETAEVLTKIGKYPISYRHVAKLIAGDKADIGEGVIVPVR